MQLFLHFSIICILPKALQMLDITINGEESDGRKLVGMLSSETDHFLDMTHVRLQAV